jgi:hypothetical protein
VKRSRPKATVDGPVVSASRSLWVLTMQPVECCGGPVVSASRRSTSPSKSIVTYSKKALLSISHTTMTPGPKGSRESKPPLKGCGAEPPALFLFQDAGRLISGFFGNTSMRAGIYCEEDRPKKFLGVPNHRPAFRVGMLPGQLSQSNVFCFIFCSKERISQEFFYYNMLHNSINNGDCCVQIPGGMESEEPTLVSMSDSLCARLTSWGVNVRLCVESTVVNVLESVCTRQRQCKRVRGICGSQHVFVTVCLLSIVCLQSKKLRGPCRGQHSNVAVSPTSLEWSQRKSM